MIKSVLNLSIALLVGAMVINTAHADVPAIRPKIHTMTFTLTNKSKFPQVLFLVQYDLDQKRKLSVVNAGANQQQWNLVLPEDMSVTAELYAISNASEAGKKILSSTKTKDWKAFQTKCKDVNALLLAKLQLDLAGYRMQEKDAPNNIKIGNGKYRVVALKQKGKFAFVTEGPVTLSVPVSASHQSAFLFGIPLLGMVATGVVMRKRRMDTDTLNS